MTYDWIFLDFYKQPNSFYCRRCEESIVAPTPCKVDTMIEVAKAFLKVHKKCKERLK